MGINDKLQVTDKRQEASKERVYFLHIPKTAGSSVSDILRRSNRFSICPAWLWGQLLQMPRSELEQYSLFIGHFYGYLEKYIGECLTTFTYLRNPFARALSHYEHIRRDPGHYFHARVKRQGSFLKFLQDPLTRPLVESFQVRALSSFFDPSHLTSFITAPFENFALEEYLETKQTGLSTNDALLLAKNTLVNCTTVGITERIDDSISILKRRFGLSTDLSVQRLNTNPHLFGLQDLTPRERTLLTRLLEADWCLYEFGYTLFSSEYSSITAKD